MLAHRSLLLAVVASLALACTKPEPPPTSPPPPPARPPAAASASASPAAPTSEIDARFEKDLAQVFAEYKAWGRVDDELRWAPWLCRMPMPAAPHMSGAEDGGHAQKLYSVFARDHRAYVSNGAPAEHPEQKVAQAVVKESYLPEVISEAEMQRVAMEEGERRSSTRLLQIDHFRSYTRGKDGKFYRAAKLVGLYVILEKPSDTEGTDKGFVYATLMPNGEVTSAGRVASCMGCHVQAKHGRLFGTPRYPGQ
jgi:hypothetical protein